MAKLKDFPLTVEEVRALVKKQESKKSMWLGIAIGVIVVLIALIIWVARQKDKDLEEHYEYFDDEFDEYDDEYDDFDEAIYEDQEEEPVEYVKINDFMNYAEDEKHNETLDDSDLEEVMPEENEIVAEK